MQVSVKTYRAHFEILKNKNAQLKYQDKKNN